MAWWVWDFHTVFVDIWATAFISKKLLLRFRGKCSLRLFAIRLLNFLSQEYFRGRFAHWSWLDHFVKVTTIRSESCWFVFSVQDASLRLLGAWCIVKLRYWLHWWSLSSVKLCLDRRSCRLFNLNILFWTLCRYTTSSFLKDIVKFYNDVSNVVLWIIDECL